MVDNPNLNTIRPDAQPAPAPQGTDYLTSLDGASVTGVSNAYGTMQQDPRKTPEGPVRPNIEESKIDSRTKSDNIMDMLWNELIVHSADWILNNTVNLSLNMLNYALFPDGSSEFAGKKDYYSIGKKVYEKTAEDIEAQKQKLLNEYNATSRNIDRVLATPPQPEEWPEGITRPEHFDDMAQMVKKGREDREAGRETEETKRLDVFEQTPELIKQSCDRDKVFAKLATVLATQEIMSGVYPVSYSPEFGASLEEFNKKLERHIQGDENPRAETLEGVQAMLAGNRTAGGFTNTDAALENIKNSLTPEDANARTAVQASFETLKTALVADGFASVSPEGEWKLKDNAPAHIKAGFETIKKANDLPEPVSKENLREHLTQMTGLITGELSCNDAMRETLGKIGAVLGEEGDRLSPANIEGVKKQVEKLNEIPKNNNECIAKTIHYRGSELGGVVKNQYSAYYAHSSTPEQGVKFASEFMNNLAKKIEKVRDFMEQSYDYDYKSCQKKVKDLFKTLNTPPSRYAPERDVETVNMTNDTTSFMAQFLNRER